MPRERLLLRWRTWRERLDDVHGLDGRYGGRRRCGGRRCSRFLALLRFLLGLLVRKVLLLELLVFVRELVLEDLALGVAIAWDWRSWRDGDGALRRSIPVETDSIRTFGPITKRVPIG